MNLNEISIEIREILENKRIELGLEFFEEKHIYHMLDLNGNLKKNYPSVSKIIEKLHIPFDSKGKSYQKAKGNVKIQNELLAQWKLDGDLSTNMGSRVHYEMEIETIMRFGNYKEVRKPIFQINEEQKVRSDSMIISGKNYLDLMVKRGAVLLDTEAVLGDPELGYTGQPDKIWLVFNEKNNNIGFFITDWKTNKEKNFKVQVYNNKMLPPFEEYYNYALTHYYIQIPLYARLISKMLKNTKYNDIKFMGGMVVLLKDDETFNEYKIPNEMIRKVLSLDLTNL